MEEIKPPYLNLEEAAEELTKLLERKISVKQVLAYGLNKKISIFAILSSDAKFVSVNPIEGEQNEIKFISRSVTRLSINAVRSLSLTGHTQFKEYTNLKDGQHVVTHKIAEGETPPEITIKDCIIHQYAIEQIDNDDLYARMETWENKQKVIDYNYWLNLDILTAHEAVMLLNIHHPQRPLNTLSKEPIKTNGISYQEKITNELRLAERAQVSGQLPENASPLDWLNWAISKDLDIPTQFNEIIDTSGPTANLNLNQAKDNMKASLEVALEIEPYGLSKIDDDTYILNNAGGGKEVTNKIGYEKNKRQFNQRLKKGRYTLNDAALALEKEAKVSAEDMVKILVQSAEDGSLKMYHPFNDSRYFYGDKFNRKVTDYCEVTTYEELNKWLTENEPLISWRFPEPQSLVKSVIEKSDNTTTTINPISKIYEVFGKMDKLKPNEITLEFVAGDSGGAIFQITVRGVKKRCHLSDMDLWDKRSGEMDKKALLLLGLSHNKKIKSSDQKTAQSISRIRKLFKKHFGINDDPFQRFTSAQGYEPLFTVLDNRGNADERAKKETMRKTVSLDESKITKDFDDEDDETDRWIKNNEY